MLPTPGVHFNPTKIFAIFLFLGVIPVICFYAGMMFQEMMTISYQESVVDSFKREFTASELEWSGHLVTHMDREFGFAFDYPQSWDVQVEGNGNTTVKNIGDDNQGTITVQKISNRKITNTDSMIGIVTYFYDSVTSTWMVTDSRDNPATGEKGPRTFEALPQDLTSTGLPIFLGTGRWKTVIIPLAEEKFLLINIIGDKDTTPLTPLSHTVRKI